MNDNQELILRDKLALDRTKLANQRTLLSFLRTGLYLIITGMGVYKLIEADKYMWLVWVLIGLGVIVKIIGIVNFLQMLIKLKNKHP